MSGRGPGGLIGNGAIWTLMRGRGQSACTCPEPAASTGPVGATTRSSRPKQERAGQASLATPAQGRVGGAVPLNAARIDR